MTLAQRVDVNDRSRQLILNSSKETFTQIVSIKWSAKGEMY